MSDYEFITSEVTSTRVGVVTLNRPEVHNALNRQIRQELTQCLSAWVDDAGVGAVVMIGSGDRAFSVGADLKSSETNHSEDDFEKYVDSRRGSGWYQAVAGYPKAVIAALHGYVAGSGLQLALAADFLIGTPETKLWIPQVGLGLAPHTPTLVRLSRCVGQGRALHMALTGQRMSGSQAHAAGLLVDLVDHADLRARAVETATAVAEQPRIAVEITKQAFYQGQTLGWAEMNRVDGWKEFSMWQTPARRERHAAFTSD